MKIAVTGFRGKLGSRLVKMGVVPIKANILYPRQLRRELNSIKPDVVIHAAGMSSVAECEKHYNKAIAVNTHGTATVFEVAAEVIGEGRCILLSSDQVFDGEKGTYKESDEPNPIHEYGLTKFAAEGLATLYDNKIIRLSRGVDINEKDIVEYVATLRKGRHVHVPDFLFRSYSHLDFLMSGILDCAWIFDSLPSPIHVGGLASMSFYAFMKMIASQFGFSTSHVLPRGSEAAFAKRPHKCGLEVGLAQKLGVHLFSPEETVDRMKTEWTSKLRL